jgi:hypothetical protein
VGMSPRGVGFIPETPEEQKALDDLSELFHAFDKDGSGELGDDEVSISYV